MALWTLRFTGGGEMEASFGAGRLLFVDQDARPLVDAIRIAFENMGARIPCSATKGEIEGFRIAGRIYGQSGDN
jgi:hypothetical protein